MRPSLKGDLAAMYEAKTTKRRRTASGEFVESVYKCDLTKCGLGIIYQVRICGVNVNGVPCAAYSDHGKEPYFWQCANEQAVAEILASPEKAYDWICIKNGIRKLN